MCQWGAILIPEGRMAIVGLLLLRRATCFTVICMALHTLVQL